MDRQVVMSYDEESSQGWAAPVKQKKKKNYSKKESHWGYEGQLQNPKGWDPHCNKGHAQSKGPGQCIYGYVPHKSFCNT